MDWKEILKHTAICAGVSIVASKGIDNYVSGTSLSDEDKNAVKTTLNAAAVGAPVGYFIGEIANEGHKDYTNREKLISTAVGSLVLGGAGYWISRMVEHNGNQMNSSSSQGNPSQGGSSQNNPSQGNYSVNNSSNAGSSTNRSSSGNSPFNISGNGSLDDFVDEDEND
jgi:hypothetical protein